MSAMHVSTAVHIFVELNKNNQKKIEFHTDQVTGLQIKVAAGLPADHDLALRVGQKLDLVTNEETIQIKDGEHFVALPPGTIS